MKLFDILESKIICFPAEGYMRRSGPVRSLYGRSKQLVSGVKHKDWKHLEADRLSLYNSNKTHLRVNITFPELLSVV